MFEFKLILLSVFVCLTTGQWFPYMDEQHISPFADPLHEQVVVPKESTTKIPILFLLKPRRAKSLSTEATETVDNHPSSTEQDFSFREWLSFPDHKEVKKTKIQAKPTELEPDQEASEDDQITLKGRGGEQIKWSALKNKKNGLNAEQLSSLSQLFPKFAAMSQSNTDLAELANKNGGTLFEDALKKFTSNLTDLEHRKNEENNKSDQSDHDDINDSLENITTDIQSTRPMENIMSSQPEANDNTEEVPEEKSLTFVAEDRESHQKLRPQKTSPFLNDRNRIRLPIRTEEKSFDTQAIVGRQTNKGWVPLTNKPRPKHKPKKPVERNEIHLPSDPAPNSGHYMFPSNDNRPYGMPQTYHSMNDMSSHMFESRPFPHSYIPFDHRHQIRHRQPFHKYSYYTESELSPTLMSLDMRGDANKPSHIAPAKEAADAAAAAVDKVLGQKEQVVGKHFDDKTQLIDEKQMIIEEKPGMAGMGGMGGIEGMAGLTGGGMGEEVLGQHMTCCDLLNNNGGPQVIHEEVIKTDFDDDKFKPEVHFGSHFGNQIPHSYLHKDCKYPFRQSYPHQFYWPQHHSYRRPIYRPKLFYKPLFFG